MTTARLSGRMAGGSTGPGSASLLAGMAWRWSGGLRQRVDTLPRGGDRIGPRPGRLDFQAAAPPAADQPGGGVQYPVAQGLGLGFGQVTIQGQQLEPGQQDRGDHGGGQPRGVDLEIKRREMSQAGVLAGADGILDAGLDPVGGVDVGVLAQPALGGGGPVGGPQAIPPAVFGLEQGQLRAGMRPLTAGGNANPKGGSLSTGPGPAPPPRPRR